jgi:hypothetical protein
MKIALSAISDFGSSFDDDYPLSGVNAGGRLSFCRYSPSNIIVSARRIVLAIFVPAATFSTMVIRTLASPMILTRLFGYFFLAYWCWYTYER